MINNIDEMIKKYNLEFEKYNIEEKKTSLLRVLLFIFTTTILIIALNYNNLFLKLITLISTLIFIVLIIYHKKIYTIKDYYENYIKILKQYKMRTSDEWKKFNDIGEEFINDENYVLQDLDVIGKNSLFQFINISKTVGGRKKLINRLSNQKITFQNLIKNQQAIEEISRNLDFSINIQVLLNQIKEKNQKIDIKEDLKNLNKKTNFKMVDLVIGTILSGISILIFICALLNILNWSFFVLIVIIQFVQSYIYVYIFTDTFNIITKSSRNINGFYEICNYIENYNFSSNLLKEKQSKIKKASTGIKQLKTVNELNNLRFNFLSNIIANTFIPLNTLIIYQFSKFQKQYDEIFKEGLLTIEDFEVLCSLAIIGQVKENVCFPQMTENIKLDFTDLKHPLLNNCVSNSFNCNDDVNIITGSNMSGKTSFLRTIGINIILMNAGTYVNAKEFSASYLKIFTSMRINDDLAHGISTFYAEILRIKTAIDYQDKKENMIVLIDEIFKGTNFNDRIFGAKSIIEKLNKENVILFVTTHDFELCGIDKIKNYHFREYYENDKIKFDYKIKQGECKTTNAKYLMKIAGIIDN